MVLMSALRKKNCDREKKIIINKKDIGENKRVLKRNTVRIK